MANDIIYGTKIPCQHCGKTKKPKDMHPVSRNTCLRCNKSRRQDIKTAEAEKNKRTAFKTLVAGIRGNRINVPHTSEVAAEMIRLYGGLGEFCSEWKADLDSLRLEKPGSKAVLDAKAAVLKLVVESTNQRDSAPDLAGLSDDDLEKEFAGLAAVLLKNNTDALVEILEDAGKTVVDITDAVIVNDGTDSGTKD